MGWQDKPTIQFAVGITTIFVLLRWLLTGDLFLAVESARPTENGSVASPSFLSVVWPMVFEAVAIVGTSVIAFATRLWQVAYSLVQRVAVQPPPVVGKDDAEALIRVLARSVALRDAQSVKDFSLRIRKPYAIQEMNQAISDGKYDAAAALLREIREMGSETMQ